MKVPVLGAQDLDRLRAVVAASPQAHCWLGASNHLAIHSPPMNLEISIERRSVRSSRSTR